MGDFERERVIERIALIALLNAKRIVWRPWRRASLAAIIAVARTRVSTSFARRPL
jgi:hypothetical protein